jgi:hypothetical protein
VLLRVTCAHNTVVGLCVAVCVVYMVGQWIALRYIQVDSTPDYMSIQDEETGKLVSANSRYAEILDDDVSPYNTADPYQ